jgi:hypothetical protein
MSFDHVLSPVIQLSNSEQYHEECQANCDNDFFGVTNCGSTNKSGSNFVQQLLIWYIYGLPKFTRFTTLVSVLGYRMTNKSRPFGKQTQTCKAALPLPASIAFILMFGCATWLQRIEIGESLCGRSVDGIWSCRSGMTRRDSTILMNHDCDRWHCISSRCWQFAPKLLHHPALHAISFHHFSFISHLSHPYQTIMYHQLYPYSQWFLQYIF